MAQEEINVPPLVRFYGRPVHVEGDMDFWGPPNFWFRCWLVNRNQTVFLNIQAKWEEQGGDRSRFELRTERFIYDVRAQNGAGWYFVNFREQYDLDIGQTQIPGINSGLQEVYNSTQGLVRAVRAQGDRYGGWFGGPDDPVVEVDFNRIYFTVSND
jgi:hypothetical protein